MVSYNNFFFRNYLIRLLFIPFFLNYWLLFNSYLFFLMLSISLKSNLYCWY